LSPASRDDAGRHAGACASIAVDRQRDLQAPHADGITQSQEMLDSRGEHAITSDIEMISSDEIDTLYERMLASGVKYRFEIDTSPLKQ
jgi:D-arabinose 1-dehydrogenase-like Zn-dependent alcohol dehydrogenase